MKKIRYWSGVCMSGCWWSGEYESQNKTANGRRQQGKTECLHVLFVTVSSGRVPWTCFTTHIKKWIKVPLSAKFHIKTECTCSKHIRQQIKLLWASIMLQDVIRISYTGCSCFLITFRNCKHAASCNSDGERAEVWIKHTSGCSDTDRTYCSVCRPVRQKHDLTIILFVNPDTRVHNRWL